MKLAYFNDYRLGVVKGETIVDVSAAVADVPHVGPGDKISRIIENWATYKGKVEAASGGAGVSLESVRLRAPLPKPGKMLFMVANYLENGALAKANPINAFLKSPSAVIGDYETVTLTEQPATIFHHEAEVGLVIGKQAKNISEAEAKGVIFGYFNSCDVSARNLGAAPMDSFFPTKSTHTAAPQGPYIVTADEIPNPQDIKMQLWVDGQLRQDYSTSDMGYTIEKTVAWLSTVTTLNPGDVVSLGTNHQGLDALQNGEYVEMEGAGLGRLHFTIHDRLERKWPVGVDQEMADRVAGRKR